MLNGYIAAAVTPFKNGKVDFRAFEKYMYYLIGSGISGVVVCGSTGESLSLSDEEKIELIKTAAAVNRGKIKLISGAIYPTTEGCLEFIGKAKEYVDNFLCTCPFYIRPSQQQIYNFFKQLNDSTSRGIIVYNNPSRVGVDLGFEVFQKLSELKNIVAVKECSSDLSRFSAWRLSIKKKFNFLTGNDETACAALAMGAEGVISVSANVAPELCCRMYNAFRQNNFEGFSVLRDTLTPLHDLMFAESSPASVKYALSKLGFISNELRAPLSPISLELQEKIDLVIKGLS
ncbi:MAG: 4-hydroxy-tetrahydrodipicolinate synthase [Holosporaceae bacterium]|jgi:4-hydroxy-tetrahydrodipicolinate synthase|nr:4-hydroxy-tetrahydrodipicolinate synthase [Holosporaceae bacterium]